MTDFKRKNKDYLDMEKFMTRAEAVAALCQRWTPTPATETVGVGDAVGRICAEPLVSQNTLPVVRESMADGIAVRFSDFAGPMPDFSTWREGADYVAADTGDDFDDAFDTVINIEAVQFDDNQRICGVLADDLKKGQRVRQRGETLQKNEPVMPRGTRINPFQAGMLASAGIDALAVLARPKVACIPTGNELVPIGRTPGRGQHIETNSLMIRHLLAAWQADTLCFPIIKDQKADMEQALSDALAVADIVLINGGSSMGSEDFVSGLLSARATCMQHGVRCIPGMPAAVAMVDGKPVVNLPGPSFGAFCVMDWCVKHLVAHWYTQPPLQRRCVPARLTAPIQKPEPFDMYVRLHLMKNLEGEVLAVPIPMTARYADSAVRFTALSIAPIGTHGFEAGQDIMAELLFTETL